jgi:hypothetical protein
MIKFYSRFGSDVVGAVQAKAKPDGDINHLLSHLGLPNSGVLDRQHLTLSQFIHKYGRSAFLRAISMSGGAVAVRQFLQDLERQQIIQKRLAKEGKGSSEDPTPEEEQAQTDAAVAAKAQCLATGTKWVETEDYSGPDRRSGADRRTGPADRRQSLEVIMFKNRRFGPSRRKVASRRKNQD